MANARYGMVIDIDRCTGCGNCMTACAVENNVAPAEPRATTRTGVTWMRVFPVDNGMAYPENRTGIRAHDVPAVRPGHAVRLRVPAERRGCGSRNGHRRADSAALPRVPLLHDGLPVPCPVSSTGGIPRGRKGWKQMLNPDVAPRMRGVVEKCNFCHGRLHAAREKAASNGRPEITPVDYVPACVEACPTQAIVFGDLADPASAVARLSTRRDTFRFLPASGRSPRCTIIRNDPG